MSEPLHAPPVDAACQSASVGVVIDSCFMNHANGDGHPENPGRIKALLPLADELSDPGTTIVLPPRLATTEQIRLAHTAAYCSQVAATTAHDCTRLSGDTFASPGSFETALLAAGSAIEAVNAAVSGDVRSAMALVRPPGHHAETGRASGFCLFNNVAIGAMFARRVLGLDRVLIVDWDVHHGNGIQHIFEDDPSVLYFSAHQYPLFPGTGDLLETGRGAGEGFTVNVPMKRGMGDAAWIAVFQHLLKPVALAFNPDLVLVAAGFDSHRKDPLGKMKMTARGFGGLTRVLMDIAATCCNHRLALVLEGGYHPAATAESIRCVIDELVGRQHTDIDAALAAAGHRKLASVLSRCRKVQGRYWPCLEAVQGEGT